MPSFGPSAGALERHQGGDATGQRGHHAEHRRPEQAVRSGPEEEQRGGHQQRRPGTDPLPREDVEEEGDGEVDQEQREAVGAIVVPGDCPDRLQGEDLEGD